MPSTFRSNSRPAKFFSTAPWRRRTERLVWASSKSRTRWKPVTLVRTIPRFEPGSTDSSSPRCNSAALKPAAIPLTNSRRMAAPAFFTPCWPLAGPPHLTTCRLPLLRCPLPPLRTLCHFAALREAFHPSFPAPDPSSLITFLLLFASHCGIVLKGNGRWSASEHSESRRVNLHLSPVPSTRHALFSARRMQ